MAQYNSIKLRKSVFHSNLDENILFLIIFLVCKCVLSAFLPLVSQTCHLFSDPSLSLFLWELSVRWLTGRGKASGTHSSQVMRNDVGVNGGIVQIIPELSYIIQISFFCSPSSFIRYHCLVLWHILPRSLSVQTDLIFIPLCSSDIAAPRRNVCWDWNEDQATHHSKACRERPGGWETKEQIYMPVKVSVWWCIGYYRFLFY